MTKYENLQKEMTVALKTGNHERRTVLSNLVSAINAATITPKGRVLITDELTDQVLLKQKKLVQEQIDTCPASRNELRDQYLREMVIINEFAPSLITDAGQIRTIILEHMPEGDLPRGQRMKIAAPLFKNKADMKIVNEVMKELYG